MNQLKEYIVTLKNYEDLDSFYEDMETPGGDLYIPDRAVDCVNRRAISRNTHYLLIDEEAKQLRNDPRVIACELTPNDLGLKVVPLWTQTSQYWDKSYFNNSNYKNWGLLRCINGENIESWGYDGTRSQSATISANAEGRNVDIVIVDGFIQPNHPEMAVNNDGTGGTRVVQYNWTGTYQYGPYTGSGLNDNNHGMHVAGTAAGNTQGWARSSNIYNINPYSTDPNGMNILLLFDYIRSWHNNKSINPAAGRKNPTICNNSWGFVVKADISSISSVTCRGVTTNSNINSNLLNSVGVLNNGVYANIPYRYAAIQSDIVDAINDGIIITGAAGNDGYKIDVTNGIDYNNYVIWNGNLLYYHRGMSPASDSNCICVGSADNGSNELKSNFSNCGPRIDIYAPGEAIQSSLISGPSNDTRNIAYKLGKYNGTSMASPQVTGVIACLLENYPDFNQSQVIDYLIKNSRYNQINDTNGNFEDRFSLQGSPNRYLFYYKERSDTGSTWPKLNYLPRPSTGRMFPRVRVRR